MGIESEQLVYDYLSRVGDLAGQTGGLTAAERVRLVNDLRQAIDSQRAANSSSARSSSARAEVGSVRKILAGLGTPEQVVRRAAGGGGAVGSGPAVPTASAPGPSARTTPSVPRSVPTQGGAPSLEGRAEFVRADAGSVPATGAQWWTFESGGGGFPGAGGVRMIQPPGWSGSFEGDFLVPEGTAVVDPVTGLPAAQPAAAAAATGAGVNGLGDTGRQAAAQPRPGLLRRLRGGATAGAAGSVPRAPIPFVEALATLVLVGGAVTGLWYIAILGWLLAYAGRRFGHGVGRVAALWIPGLMAAACGFWLYSKSGHTGHPALTNAQVATATHNAYALWLRGSSALSAAFLAWRITRR
ncbi:hypothetical protein [Streptacidiphilus neutrinimicus]|uniref:hypothetical protein n=1 Tax=Streptacidiphilus neutrinimicus TaxID=105420 RepID=UPI0005AA796F|nr:hypothetical protein [Streptacidiphilus neutrinimicus]